MERDDKKAKDAIPEWDGNPGRWRHFETAVKWFPRTLKRQERDLAANRIIGRMLQSKTIAIRTFATTLDPDRYENPNGHLLLLDDLRSSPLGKLPIPDAAHKIKHYYKDFKRPKGETVGALLIREQDCYSEMVQALERLLEEMGDNDKYKQCQECFGYFERDRGAAGRGQWYCQRCWDTWDGNPDTPATAADAAPAEEAEEAYEYERHSTTSRSQGSRTDRFHRQESMASKLKVSEAMAVGSTFFGHASGVLKVLRGFFLLEAMDFTEKEKQDVRVVTQNRLDFDAISKALKERWEDKALVQRDFGPRAMPRYGPESGQQSALAAEFDDVHGPDWYDGYAAAVHAWENEGYDHHEDEDDYDIEEEPQLASEPEGSEAVDEDLNHLNEELEAAQAMAAEASRTLVQARQAVAAAHKDRGPKGGKGGKGDKYRDRDRDQKGKNANYLEFHTITHGFDELQGMYQAEQNDSGLAPSKAMVDCGASASAGGERAVQALVAAVAAANPQARIEINQNERPWFRFGDNKWGKALYKVSVEFEPGFVLGIFALSPGVPLVLLGMTALESWPAIVNFRTGEAVIRGRLVQLRKTPVKGHCILDLVKHVSEILNPTEQNTEGLAKAFQRCDFRQSASRRFSQHAFMEGKDEWQTVDTDANMKEEGTEVKSPSAAASSGPTTQVKREFVFNGQKMEYVTSEGKVKEGDPGSTHQGRKKEKQMELDPAFALQVDPRDPRTTRGPCGKMHRKYFTVNNQWGQTRTCYRCGLRLLYIPTTNAPMTNLSMQHPKLVESGLELVRHCNLWETANHEQVTAMINIATSLRRPWDRDPPRAGRAAGDAGGSEPQAQGPGGGTSTRAGLSRVPRQLLAAGRRRSLLAGLALAMTVGTITEAVEICCHPNSMLTDECTNIGLSMERISIENGYNLSTKAGFEAAGKKLDEVMPKRAWISLPCTLWTSLTNFNYQTPEARARLEKYRLRDRRRVKYGVLLLLKIVDDGGEIYFEWPHRCQGWKIPELKFLRMELRRRGRHVFEDRIDGCMYGLRDYNTNELVEKGWRILTTDPEFSKVATVCDHSHGHRVINGKQHTAATAYYPQAMCKAIARLWHAQLRKPIDLNMALENPAVLDLENAYLMERDTGSIYVAEPTDLEREQVRAILSRIHKAAGHPGNEHLAYWCKKRQCPRWIIEEAIYLRCEACDLVKHGLSHKVKASLDIPMAPWQAAVMDVSDLTFPDLNVKARFLLIAEVATGLMGGDITAKIGLKDKGTDSSATLFTTFARAYLQHYPKPRWVFVDPQTSFVGGEFKDNCQLAGIGVSAKPGGAHWMAGDIERRISIVKQVMRKLRLQYPKLSPETVFYISIAAANNMDNIKGYTPMQWAFGFSPTEDPILAHNAATGKLKSDFFEIERARADAEATYLKEKASRKISELKNSAPRPRHEYKRGDWVCVWRSHAATGKRKLSGQDFFTDGLFIGPGRVLFSEPAVQTGNKDGVIWVIMGNRCWRCAAEQLRPATQSEIVQINLKKDDILNSPLEDVWRHLQDFDDIAGEPYPTADGMRMLPRQPLESMPRVIENPDVAVEPHDVTEAEGDQEVDEDNSAPEPPQIKRTRVRGKTPTASWPPVPTEAFQPRFGRSSSSRASAEVAHAALFQAASDHAEASDIDIINFVQDPNNESEMDLMKIEIEADLEEFCFDASAYLEKQLNRVANNTVKKGVEVSFGRLSPEDKPLFQEAMARGLAEHLEVPTVRAASDYADYNHGKDIPADKLIKMRWLLTWKPLTPPEPPDKSDPHPVSTPDGKFKAKARIIMLGFSHPDLVSRDKFGDRNLLKEMLRWSPWRSTPCMWAGTWITQEPSGKIHASQEEFCHQLLEIRVESGKYRSKDDKLKPEDVTQFRAGLMKCQWRTTQTAPQFSCRVPLLAQRVNEATFGDLKDTNALIRDVKRTARDSLVFHNFNSNCGGKLKWDDLVIATWVGASRLLQRGGYIVGFTTAEILKQKECAVSIADWRSYKLKRTGIGTNGCEGQAVYDGENAAYLMRLLWSVMHGVPVTAHTQEEVAQSMTSVLVIDSRGVHDSVRNKESFGIGLSDARTGVEVLHVKANCGPEKNQHLVWVPSDLNLTDGLTKDSPEARKPLAMWLARRTWIIRYDEDFMSARKRQRANKLAQDKPQPTTDAEAEAADALAFLDLS
ncbi:unnamed protein product [Prorocentrum cordatum]|uniref:Integrase catalytic domain-containing protein n=1 Tax=Prorocentrum cordatum TaxID=2364126 RepID=A0ABN9VPG5_9DINO|nr:unnamed protein product [Polarella glacialis]